MVRFAFYFNVNKNTCGQIQIVSTKWFKWVVLFHSSVILLHQQIWHGSQLIIFQRYNLERAIKIQQQQQWKNQHQGITIASYHHQLFDFPTLEHTMNCTLWIAECVLYISAFGFKTIDKLPFKYLTCTVRF